MPTPPLTIVAARRSGRYGKCGQVADSQSGRTLGSASRDQPRSFFNELQRTCIRRPPTGYDLASRWACRSAQVNCIAATWRLCGMSDQIKLTRREGPGWAPLEGTAVAFRGRNFMMILMSIAAMIGLLRFSVHVGETTELAGSQQRTPRHNSLSRVIGNSLIRLPVAWKTAFAMAAATPTTPISPRPLRQGG